MAVHVLQGARDETDCPDPDAFDLCRGDAAVRYRPVSLRTLTDFLGAWRVERSIRQDDGSEGRFEGTAEWRPEDGGALYRETGQVWLGGQGPFLAERKNRWATDLRVFFEDGRFFHQVPPQGGEVAHWCPPDQYDGLYDFARWPVWQVTWRVDGPRKAYVSSTTYTRAGA
ncbi:DUF6314 family protein [Antarctobacter sp.]|uniref:DUF6314 family protein n=1 Tax=Antarctobacter sp. TaxID=1872577 RepID=UPI002B264FF5|nr:DUF6314 family protein [Antarctobacter sp.]